MRCSANTCVFCEAHRDDETDWYANHEQECQKNFEGSSPAMEMEGWKRIWARSEEKYKFRYVTVISDGDSKAFSAVKNEKCMVKTWNSRRKSVSISCSKACRREGLERFCPGEK